MSVLVHQQNQLNLYLRVPGYIRDADAKAYEPRILAVGPYYRGSNNENLATMEDQKICYVKMLLQRYGEASVQRLVQAIKEMEGQARSFYAEDVIANLGSDEFVKMMLLDGCFIVELLRRYAYVDLWNAEDSSDSNFNFLGCDKNKLARDLLLVENQLPFFVLEKLFEIENQVENHYFIATIFYFFTSTIFPGQNGLFSKARDYPNGDIKHLLSLVHGFCFSSSESQAMGHSNGDFKKWILEQSWKFISCATELREGGIKFKAVQKQNLCDIEFDSGTLKVPTITITDQSESIFKNLIVYEQFFLEDKNFTVTNYMKFMDCLINSSKDVKLLCRRNVLHNRLGDHEVVADLFNRLGDFFTPSGPHGYYSEIFEKVDRHCTKRRTRWMAILKINYFNSPWASISVFAAVVLLLLTLGQTVFSVLAYYDK